MTKPKGATSYRETAFGTIPRHKFLTADAGNYESLEMLMGKALSEALT